VNTLKERQECLERVLQINPDNARAQQALAALSGQQVKSDVGGGVKKESIAQLREQRKPKPPRPQSESDEKSGGNELLGIIAVFGALIVAGLLLLTQLPNILTPAPAPTVTPLPVVVVVEEPTSINSPIPSPTSLPPPTFDGTSGAPTLPPTFTPTPTITPTATTTPTATPVPLTEFTLYYVGLAPDATAPSLYLGVGDGSNLTLVGDDFRDIAIDASGQFMAFVRDVPTDVGGQTLLRPQLHIAPINDLSQARAITNFTGTIVSSPSWSPDAKALVFVTNVDGDEDIWYINADGTSTYALTDNPYMDIQPAWSPVANSLTVIFASDRDSVGSTELYSMTIPEPNAPDNARRITDADKNSYSPVWNPKGTHIAFVSDRNTDADIFIMGADGSNLTLLTEGDDNAEDRAPTFTTDGRYVAFISNRIGDQFAVYVTNYTGNELTPLAIANDTQALQVFYLPELIFRLR
ncbi:MAG: hypothetical protein MUE54_15125, partial [Anaerolineae bacterium]|nr:hypothetical protein [Anaerolineae bacterium]